MLAKRIITSLVLAPIMIGGIFFLPLHQFALFIGVIVVFGGWEWANLAGWSSIAQRLVYVAFLVVVMAGIYFSRNQFPALMTYILWCAFAWWAVAFFMVAKFPETPNGLFKTGTQLSIGLIVLVPMWVGLYQLKLNPNSTLWIIYLMFVVWGADVGAYFVGKAIGKRKLAPKVSPGKSWEGVMGGTVCVLMVATVAGLYFSQNGGFSIQSWIALFVISVVVMASSILGDLVESMFKRHRGVKDSSNILPGHGGVLDRADSLTSSVPVFALLLNFI